VGTQKNRNKSYQKHFSKLVFIAFQFFFKTFLFTYFYLFLLIFTYFYLFLLILLIFLKGRRISWRRNSIFCELKCSFRAQKNYLLGMSTFLYSVSLVPERIRRYFFHMWMARRLPAGCRKEKQKDLVSG
jgi:hypothetical protein